MNFKVGAKGFSGFMSLNHHYEVNLLLYKALTTDARLH